MEIFDVYTIREPKKDGEKSYWIKLGVAFKNRDESLNVILDGYPANGKLHIRKQTKKDKQEGSSQFDDVTTPQDGYGEDIPF